MALKEIILPQPGQPATTDQIIELWKFIEANSYEIEFIDKKAYLEVGERTVELGKEVEKGLPEESSTGGVITTPPVVAEPVVEPYVPIADLSQQMIPAGKPGSLLIKVQAGGLFNLAMVGNSKKKQYGKYFTLGKPKDKKLFVKQEPKGPRPEELVQSTGALEVELTFSADKISFRKGDELLMEQDRPQGVDLCFKDVSMTGATAEGKGVQPWQ